MSKKYESPVTPYERLLANARVMDSQKDAPRETFRTLDPVRLLSKIRGTQHDLTALEVSSSNAKVGAPEQSLDRFVDSLSTAWKKGEVRPTHRKPTTGPRPWRTRVDPFVKTGELVEQWLNEQPDTNAKDLLHRLQQADPTIKDSQLRTLRTPGPRVAYGSGAPLGRGDPQLGAGDRRGRGHSIMGASPPNPRISRIRAGIDSRPGGPSAAPNHARP